MSFRVSDGIGTEIESRIFFDDRGMVLDDRKFIYCGYGCSRLGSSGRVVESVGQILCIALRLRRRLGRSVRTGVT